VDCVNVRVSENSWLKLNGHEANDLVFGLKVVVGANSDGCPLRDHRQTFKTPVEADLFAVHGRWNGEEEVDLVGADVECEVHGFGDSAQEESDLSEVEAHS